MKLSKKILNAINEGMLNALADIDDEDIELTKSSISALDNLAGSRLIDKLKYSDKITDIIDKCAGFISINDYNTFLLWYKKYNAQFKADDSSIRILFKGLADLKQDNLDLNWIDMFNVTDIRFICEYWPTFNCDISKWNVSNIIYAKEAFDGCKRLDCDLSNWDLSNLTVGDRMFANCYKLTKAPKLSNMNIQEDCYIQMFYNCASLAIAPELPADELAESCYQYMFEGCQSLIKAPTLPALILAEGCYQGMFSDCTSLINAPALPATKLASYCYTSMFFNCESLVNIPALPATDLKMCCYNSMFAECKSIEIGPELPAKNAAYGCYISMFEKCVSLKELHIGLIFNHINNPLNSIFSGIKTDGILYIKKPMEYSDYAYYLPITWKTLYY